MRSLPEKALSIRQPWAWAILHADPVKDIENRTWQATRHGLEDYNGRFAIHAAKGMTQNEYETAARFMRSIGVQCPPAHELQRGGIIGTVELVECVKEHDSPWFFGPRGLVLRETDPCDFIPCKGALGFFNWERDDTVSAPIAKWMHPATQEGWETWQPHYDEEEMKFCDLVCSDCSKCMKNEGDYPIGCAVLYEAINHGGTDIQINKAKDKIRCTKHTLKGQQAKHRCKHTPDLFGEK